MSEIKEPYVTADQLDSIDQMLRDEIEDIQLWYVSEYRKLENKKWDRIKVAYQRHRERYLNSHPPETKP